MATRPAKTPFSRAKLLVAAFVLALAGLAAAGLGGFAQNAQSERGILSDFISKALSTETSQVSIGSVDGALSSDATIRDIVLSDRDGPWLRLDRARLVWTRSALLFRRLEVNRLELGRLEILRRPAPQPAARTPATDAPLLPELPLKLIVEAFQLGELALGQAVLGQAARLSATGRASLGPPAEGLDLTFQARRLDRAGEASLRLLFVPQTTRLEIAARVAEPQGGLIATLADLPERPAVTLDLNGAGPLDGFRSTLNFTAGPAIGARGEANLARNGPGRELTLGLEARIAGLLPTVAAPVFEGSTRLDGAVAFRDDGGLAIRQLALVSALARMDVSGRYESAGAVDLRLTAAARPNAGGKTVASGTEIGALAFDATVQGPLRAPRVNARLDAADAVTPQGRLGKLGLSFTATPSGPIGEPGARIALVSDGEATGVALAEPALARFVGDRVVFTLRGVGQDDGAADVETLRLALAGVTLDYRGRLGPARVLGELKAGLPDLGRLSGFAGRPLAGRAELAAALDATPRNDAYGATLTGRADALATGEAALDRLLAGELALNGRIAALAGDLTVEGFRLAGRHAAITADGGLGPRDSNLRLAATVPDLRRADPRLSGRAEATAALAGPRDRLDAALRLAVADATALGRPVPRLAIDATIRDLQGALDTRLTLAGEVDGKPARGTVALARLPGDGWNLSTLDLAIGSVTLAGALTLDPDSRAAGRIALAARDLNDLSPLALTRLGGSLDAALALAVVEGRQNIDLTAAAARLQGPSLTLERLEATLRATDIHGRPALDGSVAVDRAVIAGEPVSAIRLDSKGSPAASDVTLSATARGFSLSGAGRLVPGEPLRFDLAAFEARRDARRIALAAPATLRFPAGGVVIEGLALAVDGGRIALDGRAGEMLDLTLSARDVPLSAARIAAPGLDLAGLLNAQARITGPAARPEGPWSLRIDRFAAPETRRAGLPPATIAASGVFGAGRTSVEATLAAGRFVDLSVRGSAPLGAGALDLTARGRLDAALANPLLGAQGQRVTGAVALDLAATGTTAAPRLSGSATLSGGSFTDALQGVRLTGVEARVAAQGERLTIERASARTRNGGQLSASGQVRLDPGAGFPGAIALRGTRAELVSNGIVTAVADLALTLDGPLARRPRIAGRIDLSNVEVAVPDRLPSTLRPVDGIRHVRPGATAAARLASAGKAQGPRRTGARAAPAFDAGLALTVSAPGRVFICGRGIDAELGGEVRVGGSLAAPSLQGGFDLRRGRLSVLTQRLDFSRGRLTFVGGVIPELDFVAETRAGDVTARILVTGPADQPAFAFTSQPELPQDEVLSRLLFARASGSLSPFQALQLAQAASQFAGGGGDDTFERLRRSLGVDNLDIQVGAGGPTVGVSRAIGDRATIGFKAGARPQDSGVSIDIELTRRLKLQAETNAGGGAAVGIGAEWEY